VPRTLRWLAQAQALRHDHRDRSRHAAESEHEHGFAPGELPDAGQRVRALGGEQQRAGEHAGMQGGAHARFVCGARLMTGAGLLE
jgi:hypothetical protein